MVRYYYCVELERPGAKHLFYHRIAIPVHGGGDRYRQVVSMNAFFWSGSKNKLRSDRNVTETRRYHGHWDHDFVNAWWRQEDVPMIKHESLWAFYKHIGYNYKTREYEASVATVRTDTNSRAQA